MPGLPNCWDNWGSKMETPDLLSYDYIVVNSSAGKDSQAMLDYLFHLCDALGITDRMVVVHADLGRVEWKATRELAEAQANHYGLRFMVTQNTNGDLLSQVEKRGMWPDSLRRYCTSDHKRGPISRMFTVLYREFVAKGGEGQARILNCLGMRAEESNARSKLVPFEFDKRASSGRRHVDRWLPIHAWKVDEVWSRIRVSGVAHHYAYDLGMPRLSCVFCIFAPRTAITLAGYHNPELLAEYARIEQEIGHQFRGVPGSASGFSFQDIITDLATGHIPDKVADWSM